MHKSEYASLFHHNANPLITHVRSQGPISQPLTHDLHCQGLIIHDSQNPKMKHITKKETGSKLKKHPSLTIKNKK